MVKAARLIMVSNYLISVLFAVFLAAHIASLRGRFLNRAIVRHAPPDSCATLPLFKEFLCRHFSLVVCFSFGSLYSLRLLVHPGLHSAAFRLTEGETRCPRPGCGPFHPFKDALWSNSPRPPPNWP